MRARTVDLRANLAVLRHRIVREDERAKTLDTLERARDARDRETAEVAGHDG